MSDGIKIKMDRPVQSVRRNGTTCYRRIDAFPEIQNDVVWWDVAYENKS
jgi:hypothetical protein